MHGVQRRILSSVWKISDAVAQKKCSSFRRKAAPYPFSKKGTKRLYRDSSNVSLEEKTYYKGGRSKKLACQGGLGEISHQQQIGKKRGRWTPSQNLPFEYGVRTRGGRPKQEKGLFHWSQRAYKRTREEGKEYASIARYRLIIAEGGIRKKEVILRRQRGKKVHSHRSKGRKNRGRDS